MAFTLDAHTNDGVKTGQVDYSFNHTVAGGANLLIVTFAIRHDPAPQTIAGVTYDSVSMTKAVGETNAASGDDYHRTEIWYLENPNSGNNSVSIDITGASADWIVAAATSFSGGASSPLDDTGSHNTDSQVATATFNLTAAEDNELFIDVIVAENSNTGEPTDPTRTAKLHESTSGGTCAASSYILSVDAGTDTYNYPVGGTDYMSYAGAIFKASAVAGGSFVLNLL